MLSKSQQSFVKSLQLKKFRKLHGLFIAEGLKSITEFQKANYAIQKIYYVPEKIPKMDIFLDNEKYIAVTSEELAKISALKHPQEALAIVEIPSFPTLTCQSLRHTYALVLDDIQDPGNLGTIIRTADWFGFSYIICSDNTADIYNPKVVQATMGSLAHLQVHYVSLEDWLNQCSLPKYGTFIGGDSIYRTSFESEGLIIFGNEGKGITPAIEKMIDYKITIPKFGQAESLNVAQSVAVVCSELKR